MQHVLRRALIACTLTAISALPGVTPPVAAAPVTASSAAGTWTGPFLGYTFTFEFAKSDKGWTGRYRSTKGNKWADVQNLEVVGSTVRFNVVSQPPSLYTLTLDQTGRTLAGSVQIGKFPAMPLNLTRAL